MTADVPDVNTADEPDEREPYCDRCDDTGQAVYVSSDGTGWFDACPKCGAGRWPE